MRFKEFRKRAQAEAYATYLELATSKLSIRLSYVLVRSSITPNQVTLMSMLVAFLAAGLVLSPAYWIRLVGVVVWFVAYVLDLCDGDIARYKKLQSRFGHWFEAVSDRAKDLVLLAAITFLAFSQFQATWVIWAGTLALGGTLLHAYAISYGFKAAIKSRSSLITKFGNIHYGLMAVFIVLNFVPAYLVFVAVTSLGAVGLNVFTTWKEYAKRHSYLQ